MSYTAVVSQLTAYNLHSPHEEKIKHYLIPAKSAAFLQRLVFPTPQISRPVKLSIPAKEPQADGVRDSVVLRIRRHGKEMQGMARG